MEKSALITFSRYLSDSIHEYQRIRNFWSEKVKNATYDLEKDTWDFQNEEYSAKIESVWKAIYCWVLHFDEVRKEAEINSIDNDAINKSNYQAFFLAKVQDAQAFFRKDMILPPTNMFYKPDNLSKEEETAYRKTFFKKWITNTVNRFEKYGEIPSMSHLSFFAWYSLYQFQNSLEYQPANDERELRVTVSAEENEKLLHKQQIILLSELGVFDIPAIKGLSTESKGKLFANLLNRGEKSTTEYIRNLDTPRSMVSKDQWFVRLPAHQKKVQELIKLVGFSKM